MTLSIIRLRISFFIYNSRRIAICISSHFQLKNALSRKNAVKKLYCLPDGQVVKKVNFDPCAKLKTAGLVQTVGGLLHAI